MYGVYCPAGSGVSAAPKNSSALRSSSAFGFSIMLVTAKATAEAARPGHSASTENIPPRLSASPTSHTRTVARAQLMLTMAVLRVGRLENSPAMVGMNSVAAWKV